ncbi:MAG: hydroxyisourate hydrolase [Pirellulaceae bacterium]|nr:hydroxyisourate hydrolase [Pirellulaceae bacterium]
MKNTITTHILNTSTGKPAAGVPVRLEIQTLNTWQLVAQETTDNDGRITDFLNNGALVAGIYRLIFDTREYFAATGQQTFFPQVTIEFEISSTQQHYHVPLLLSPYGYSVYRGS